jgi:hypothetical protein
LKSYFQRSDGHARLPERGAAARAFEHLTIAQLAAEFDALTGRRRERKTCGAEKGRERKATVIAEKYRTAS